MLNIDGIGETQVNSIKSFFSNKSNIRVLNELEKILIINNAVQNSDNGLLKNKTFLVTGKLNGISILIPFNFPVTKKVLFFNKPLSEFWTALLIIKIFSNSFKTLIFDLFEKKLFIEFTCVSPIPSMFNKSS